MPDASTNRLGGTSGTCTKQCASASTLAQMS